MNGKDGGGAPGGPVLPDPPTGAERVHRWLDSDRGWLLDQLMRGEVPLPGGYCRAPLTALEQRLIRTYLSTGEAPGGWRAALLDAIALEIKRVQERHGRSADPDVPRTATERRRYEVAVEALRAELAAAALEARRTGWQHMIDELRAGLLRLNGFRDRLHAEQHSGRGVDPVVLRFARLSGERARRTARIRIVGTRVLEVALVVLVVVAGVQAFSAIDELIDAGPSAHRALIEQGDVAEAPVAGLVAPGPRDAEP